MLFNAFSVNTISPRRLPATAKNIELAMLTGRNIS
jgi:hypothetical protein